jgi:hypothetical protein
MNQMRTYHEEKTLSDALNYAALDFLRDVRLSYDIRLVNMKLRAEFPDSEFSKIVDNILIDKSHIEGDRTEYVFKDDMKKYIFTNRYFKLLYQTPATNLHFENNKLVLDHYHESDYNFTIDTKDILTNPKYKYLVEGVKDIMIVLITKIHYGKRNSFVIRTPFSYNIDSCTNIDITIKM